MANEKRMTRREQALAAQKAKQRRQQIQIGGITLAALVVLGGLFWLANRPKTADYHIPPGANGTAWGPSDAPVVVQVWSDFN